MEVLVASSQKGPHRAGPLIDVALFSLTGVVGQERAIETGVRVLYQFNQESLIELEQARELLEQLMNRI